MTRELDAYWAKEIGKELTCKCGRTHYKERRKRSNVCGYCLAEENERKLLSGINKVKSTVFHLIKVWKCSQCLIVKPYSEFSSRKKGKASGKCKNCYNERSRELYFTPKERDEFNKEREWRQLTRYGLSVRAEWIKCADCGELELRKNNSHVRCHCCRCYQRRASAYRNFITYNPIKECAVCGSLFSVNKVSRQRYCNNCASKAKEEQKRIERARYRAQKRGAYVSGVVYDPVKVFNRDKWRCYICGVKTQKRDIYADNAAEVDHILPLSKGGKDIPSNVRCCCRKCNRDKADSIIPITGNLFCQVQVDTS